MQLIDFVKPENILVSLESTEKDVLFAEMVESLVRSNSSLDRNEVLSAISEREMRKNTAILSGVAVPHAEISSIKSPLVCIGISRKGIDYEVESVESKNYKDSFVHLVFLILFEKGNIEKHLHLLSDCARLFQIPDFLNSLMTATSAQEVCSIIREFED